jgi:hypothetical protein
MVVVVLMTVNFMVMVVMLGVIAVRAYCGYAQPQPHQLPAAGEEQQQLGSCHFGSYKTAAAAAAAAAAVR